MVKYSLPRVITSKTTVKWAKCLIAAIVLIHVTYFSIYHFTEYKIEDISKLYSSYTSGDDSTQPQQPINNLAEGSSGMSLQRKINKKFAQIEKDKNRFWLAQTGLTETEIDVTIKPFLSTFDDDTSWKNKNELFYDPRFTLSIYLNEIKQQALSQSDKAATDSYGKIDFKTVNPITLPFSWADWMDLTLLNDELGKPMEERITCQYIKERTNNNPDTSYFCLENEKLTDEQVKELGFKHKEQLPGFLIHGHSSHDDRPYNNIRVLESKSYALTYLPKPNRVILLNGDKKGGTFEFMVDQSDNLRLATSDMVTKYLRSNNIDPEKVEDDTVVKFDHTNELKDLLDKVTPKYLPEEEDKHNMYQILRRQKNPKASREMVLSKEMFHYPPAMISLQIEFYEHKNDIPLAEISRQERMYYEGLKECSNYNDDNEPTYFKMATIRIDDDKNRDHEWGWHYDWRFFNGALNYKRNGWSQSELIIRTNIILDRLLRNWNRFAEEKGIVTWIMHGPLLSWYWDGLMFPFDVDIDIQMPMMELARLAKDYNQTLVLEDPNEGYGKYLIDVGTYIHNRGISKQSNHIDARFVDVDSGIYIDITGLSKSAANTPEEYVNNDLVSIDKGFHDDQVEIYNDRRKHFYKLEQLSPLKYSMMGGVPVYIPLTITDRLIFEYAKGLSSYEFNDWYFVHKINLWLRKEQIAAVFDENEIRNNEGNIDKDKLLVRISKMTDAQVLKLLEDDIILVEYYLTKQYTDIHARERKYLFDHLGRDNTALKDDKRSKQEYNKLTSTFKMKKPLRKALFDFENIERLKHHIADID
mmetsp:Transcript_5678/g.6749  ORF Transcript_5678/g.6749 Transcript_5678/m.6749 type:complete len:811 (-) Transcript_5678:9581-12013(-)